MLERTLASAEERRLDPVPLESIEGEGISLAQLLGEEATVVVFWSRYCGFSQQAMPRVAELAERFARLDVPVVPVTRDPRGEAEEYLAEQDLGLTAFLDAEGTAAREFGSWGTPQYFVVDGEGRLRFAFSSLSALPRQVEALRAEPGLSAAGN